MAARRMPDLDTITHYFPTPRTSDSTGQCTHGEGSPDLSTVIANADLGDYGPAIERWADVIDAPAPTPWDLNQNGGRRVNQLFHEWLMGVPGRISSVPGLSRRQRIRIGGNGVVPVQAEVAFTHLLEELKS